MSLRTSEFYYKNKSNEVDTLGRSVPEQLYSLRASLDSFISKLVFPGDEDGLSRVLWAPYSYVFARRFEQLGYDHVSSPTDDLQMPFNVYHRMNAWNVDDRPAGSQLSSVMSKLRWGHDNTGFEAQAYYAYHDFNSSAIFSSERDAHHAQSMIFWWNNRQHWASYKLLAGGTEIEIPATIELIGGPEIREESNMSEWMKSRKMSIVDYTFRVRTPLLKVEPDQPPIYLTESVAHYFNNRHFSVPEDQLPTTAEGWEEISQTLVVDMESFEDAPIIPSGPDNFAKLINVEYNVGTFAHGSSTVPLEFTWEYNLDPAEYPDVRVPDEVIFYVHRGRSIDTYTLDMSGETLSTAPTSYTIEDNNADSVFDVRMSVLSHHNGGVLNYHYQITTPTLPDRYKGLGGLKGMTL